MAKTSEKQSSREALALSQWTTVEVWAGRRVPELKILPVVICAACEATLTSRCTGMQAASLDSQGSISQDRRVEFMV